jgi:hypothetical protein
MPLSAPTVASDPASQAHTTAALATVTGFVDDANTAIAAVDTLADTGIADAATAQDTADDTKAALLAWVLEVKQYFFVTNTYKPNAEPIPAALANAFTNLETALAP